MNTNSVGDGPFYLVAVHGGAGHHDPSTDREVKLALKTACRQAQTGLSRSGLALSAAEQAIAVLEDAPCLNAGFGSNLTLDGRVECDAALMDCQARAFGSVGAVAGVKNPIRLARAVLDYSRRSDPLGRVPPMTLVSSGAHAFAQSLAKTDLDTAVRTVPPEDLIAPSAEQNWRRWTSRLQSATLDNHEFEHISDASADSALHHKQDTVGAVAMDENGGVAAGVSSGGLLLKLPGRLGEAAVYGAGCWAQQDTTAAGSREASEQPSVTLACSVSGAGELIIKAGLGRAIGDAFAVKRGHISAAKFPLFSPGASGAFDIEVNEKNVPGVDSDDDWFGDEVATDQGCDIHDVLQKVLEEALEEPSFEGERNAGVLLLVNDAVANKIPIPRLFCAFTTPSMAIAYSSSTHPKPKAMILRRTTTSDKPTPIYITALPL